MNRSLARFHIALFYVMILLATIVAALGFRRLYDPLFLVFVYGLFLPMIVLHFFAARGARQGKSYGRILSYLYGIIAVFGFPIGTALAVYVFSQVGKKWERAG